MLYNDHHKNYYQNLYLEFDQILSEKKLQLDQFRFEQFDELIFIAEAFIGKVEDCSEYLFCKFLAGGSAALESDELEHFYEAFISRDVMSKEKLHHPRIMDGKLFPSRDRREWFKFVMEAELDLVRNIKLQLLDCVTLARLTSQPFFKKPAEFNCKLLGISTYGYLHFYLEEGESYLCSYELYECNYYGQQDEMSENLEKFKKNLCEAGLTLNLKASELLRGAKNLKVPELLRGAK